MAKHSKGPFPLAAPRGDPLLYSGGAPGASRASHYPARPLMDRDATMPTTPERDLLLHGVEHARDPVLLLDALGRILYGNRSALATYGYAAAELLALTIHDLDTDFPPHTWATHWASLKRAGNLTVTVRHRTRDGAVLPVEINDTYQQRDGVEYSLVVVRDLRHRPGSDERAQLMQFSIDHLDDSVYWIGPDARIHYANDAACRNLGYAYDELLGKSVHDLDPNFQQEIWPLHWEELQQRQRLRFETLHRRRDGSEFPVEVTANYLRVGEREYNCAFSRDITQRKLAEGQLRQMATRDQLTGLPNRTLLQDRILQELARTRREESLLAVLFIDLDRMHQLNAQHGTAAGDEVLVAVAGRLSAALRAHDTVARWGDDQFAVLAPDLGRADRSGDLAQKLLDTLRLPLPCSAGTLGVTASIGVALCPDDGVDSETLFQSADIAMFRAKEFGGDNVQYFSADLEPDTANRIARLLELRRALRQQELRLHYQPIVDAGDGQLVGVEALVRWQHPEEGLLPPAAFLEIAEESGLIIELGQRVLDTGLAQLRAWREAGLPVPPLTVNLSPRQLRDPGLVPHLQRALQAHGLVPADLVLDLPPGLLASDGGQLLGIVEQLSEFGVGFAIDDVGHSPTHLRVLQQLSLGTLKLDVRLIARLAEEPGNAALIDALAGVAHRLGTRVLAEGVEEPHVLEEVRALGCDLVSGYATGRPMTAEAFGEWLAQRPVAAQAPGPASR
ncbi:MAG TPA: EAL domain-containing protein [Gammaproteobacteria bacterium]